MRLRLWSLLCLLALFSCQKPEKPPVPVTTVVPYDIEVGLTDLFPELDHAPGVMYDELLGYYIRLGEKTWSRTWTAGEAYVPAQTFPFTLSPNWNDRTDDFKGWYADDIRYLLVKDVRVPDFGYDFSSGGCDATARLKISLGENVPYRKVTLSELDIDFPESFIAEIEGELYGSIPELEVTSEGTVVNIHLTGFGSTDSFRDVQDRQCLSFETRICTLVTASPEDAIGTVATPPASLSIRCSLEFDRIDFSRCNVLLSEPLELPADELVWDPVPLPSYFCGDKADIVLDNPQIQMEYRSDVPFAGILNATARNDGAEASFHVSGSGTILFMPHNDGWYREGIYEVEAPGLAKLFHSPFPGGTVSPSLVLQPPAATESLVFEPGREYRMDARAEWILPFYVKGQFDGEDFVTEPILLESAKLGAEPGCRHRVSQIVGTNLPIELLITPVLEVEGEEPRYLESFRMDGSSYSKEIRITFAPARTPWTATIRYIVRPLRIAGDYLHRGRSFGVTETIFSANIERISE